jgi:hypothetical protein
MRYFRKLKTTYFIANLTKENFQWPTKNQSRVKGFGDWVLLQQGGTLLFANMPGPDLRCTGFYCMGKGTYLPGDNMAGS